ncbi:MAG: Gfo/Idh/MocA family oxidoreductase [Deltaproteobacteria bacterium]|nr:Gfo/Idh/MocA family oxidoreductase [Deltaproteobacteria bacterium]
MDSTANKSEKLRVGVVGAGRMGTYHLAKLKEHPEVEVVGFYDPNPNFLAERPINEVVRFDSLNTLLFEVDAVVISSPTATHYPNVLKAIHAGVHVLVEKPFCGDLVAAQELVELAEKNAVLIQVGFVERHRLSSLKQTFDSRELIYLSCMRHSSRMNREPSVGVIWDLMIHDVDLVLYLADEEPDSIEVMGATVVSGEYDYGVCRLRFPCGLTADLFSSRVAQNDVRALYGLNRGNSFRIDLLASNSGDPLKEQCIHFVETIRTGQASPFSGRKALRVLSPMERIHFLLASKSGRPSKAEAEVMRPRGDV